MVINYFFLKTISNKVLTPSKKEISVNNPSRSAKLRFATRSENSFSYPISMTKKISKLFGSRGYKCLNLKLRFQ